MSAAFPCAALVGGDAAFKVCLTSERVPVREADITSAVLNASLLRSARLSGQTEDEASDH